MKKNKIILSCLIPFLVMANQTNSDKYFPNEDNPSAKSNKSSFVGDDQFSNKIKIERGERTSSEVGYGTIVKTKDKYGVVHYKDTLLNKEVSSDNEILKDEYFKPDEKYQRLYKAWRNAVDTNQSQQIQDKAYEDLKAYTKTINYSQRNITLKTQEQLLLQDRKTTQSGFSLANELMSPIIVDHNTTIDSNVSKYYRSHFSPLPDANGLPTLKRSNVDKLKNAYDRVAEIESVARSKIGSSVIECYISRQLTPSYFCPFPDKTNTLFPNTANGGDVLKVSADKAKEECESSCYKKRTCLSTKVINNKDVVIRNAPLNLLNKADNETFMSKDVSPKMKIENVSFRIKVTKSKDFNGTDEDFAKFINKSGIKVIVSVKGGSNLSDIPNDIYEENVYIKKTDFVKYINVSYPLNNISVGFYKPYIFGGEGLSSLKDKAVFKKIAKIEVSEIKAHYLNDKLYFCPFKQFVDNNSQCKGKVVTLNVSGGVYHICLDSTHKAGPDIMWGGFYTKDSCNEGCIEVKECLPTYKQYANMTESQMFRATVGCVDSDENTGCSDELCKTYFSEDDRRPLNEKVIQEDDSFVYTIKNKVLTGEMRPKIDYAREMGIVTSSPDQTFQVEMKDNAMKYMLEQETYDKIKYPIGKPSPLKMAYFKNIIGDSTVLGFKIKGPSNEYDTGHEFKLYAVMRFEQIFKPKYGLYMIDGHTLEAGKDDIQFKDVYYAIKVSDTWKVFDRELFAYVKQKQQQLVCGTSDNYTARSYQKGQDIPSNCIVQNQIIWKRIYGYYKEKYGTYNESRKSYLSINKNSRAYPFKYIKFEKNKPIMKFIVSHNLYGDFSEDGFLIKSQNPVNHETSLERIYFGAFQNEYRGYIAGMQLFLIPSRSYKTVSNLINIAKNTRDSPYLIWELSNEQKYPTKIKTDNTISNKIELFKLGNDNKTTIINKVNPSFKEEGKTYFKFMFLKDGDKDPFK